MRPKRAKTARGEERAPSPAVPSARGCGGARSATGARTSTTRSRRATAELAELRQDIAALWLAFAQHDRMLRALGGEARLRPAPAPPASPSPSRLAEQAVIAAEAASIGEQLSELDEVLAAIEMATQTLERTYADEIRGAEGDEKPDRRARARRPSRATSARGPDGSGVRDRARLVRRTPGELGAAGPTRAGIP